MAKQPKEPKSPIKPVYFDLRDLDQKELRKHADSMQNFSEFVKLKLAEDKFLKEQGPIETPGFNPNELAALVETLVETKLAGHIIATDQGITNDELQVDLDQFF